MHYRLCLALLIMATAVAAQDSARAAYKHAKRLKGAQKTEYSAAAAAAKFEGVSGADLMYLGFLWRYAGELEKADSALQAFVESGEGVKNQPLVMVQRVQIVCDMKAWAKATPIADVFFQRFPGHKYQAQMRFHWGRALRMEGKTEEGLKQFTVSAKIGYVHAFPEVIDCLLQLGRYDEAVAQAKKKPENSYNAAVIAAAGNLGKPLPKLPFDHWTLKDLALAEIKEKPTLFAFWSTKARRSNEKIHAATNGWAARFKDTINAIGPTVYSQFDPVTMRVVDDMSPKAEQGFVDNWAGQYNVKYPLVLLSDDSLHKLCGLDAERPTLPAFGASGKKGMLRYVRIGGSQFALEAVEAMMMRLAKE